MMSRDVPHHDFHRAGWVSTAALSTSFSEREVESSRARERWYIFIYIILSSSVITLEASPMACPWHGECSVCHARHLSRDVRVKHRQRTPREVSCEFGYLISLHWELYKINFEATPVEEFDALLLIRVLETLLVLRGSRKDVPVLPVPPRSALLVPHKEI